MRTWIEKQISFGPRRPGSPAGEANADFIENELRNFGLANVRQESIPLYEWDVSAHSLQIETDTGWQALRSFPIPHAQFTDETGTSAATIFVSAKTFLPSKKWRGKIVVTEISFPEIGADQILKFSLGRYDPDDSIPGTKQRAIFIRVGWHLYALAAKAGAAGFVGILKDQPGGTCEMYAPYGFREKDIWDKPIPGAWVGRDDRVALRAHATAGRRINLRTLGRKRSARTSNVIGEVRAAAPSDEYIVVSCHHDSPFVSPVEDASGVSVVLSLAKYFARGKPLRANLVFLFSAGHFYGSIGTRTFLEKYRDTVVKNTKAAISIEHVALEAREDAAGALAATGQPEISVVFVPFNRSFASTVVATAEANGFGRLLLLPAEGPLGDYPPTDGGDWYKAGVPVINFISNPVYLLTSQDDLRWVDFDRLPRVAKTFSDLIEKIDAADTSLRTVDCPKFFWAMKILRRLSELKMSFFGLRPVH